LSERPVPKTRTRDASVAGMYDVFAGGEELLGQQIAEPSGGLDRPDPITSVEALDPLQQLRHLFAGGPHEPLVKHPLRGIDRDRGVGPLVWSMPIMTIANPPISRDGPRWALLIPDARAAALFRATPRRNTDGPHLVSKARRKVGRQFVSEGRFGQSLLLSRTTIQNR
jgi:hypothetical protein